MFLGSHKTRLLSLLGPFTECIESFPHTFIYFNHWDLYPFIHMKPEKGNDFERSLPHFCPFFFKGPLKVCIANRNIGKLYFTILIFVFFLYFFYHSFCRKDQFTVLILKFGIEDLTDPGLLKIWLTLNGLSLWPSKVFRRFRIGHYSDYPRDINFLTEPVAPGVR